MFYVVILAILIFVTEVITRYWIKQLTRAVQIHFQMIFIFLLRRHLRKRSQVILFFPKKFQDGIHLQIVEIKNDRSSDVHGQFTDTFASCSPLPVSTLKLLITRDRTHEWPDRGSMSDLVRQQSIFPGRLMVKCFCTFCGQCQSPEDRGVLFRTFLNLEKP